MMFGSRTQREDIAAKDYIKRKIENCIPGLEKNGVNVVLEVYLDKNVLKITATDLDGLVVFRQVIDKPSNHETIKLTISDLICKVKID